MEQIFARQMIGNVRLRCLNENLVNNGSYCQTKPSFQGTYWLLSCPVNGHCW